MKLTRVPSGNYWRGAFTALGCPCEILVDTDDEAEARSVCLLSADETRRIEHKYSRYRADSVLSRLNRSNGAPQDVDGETAQLLDYAELCWRLSEHRFDITSGVLREVWRFDGSDRLPEPAAVDALLERVGWHQLTWRRPTLILPTGMELDLGGIGKEYAVDRCALMIGQRGPVSVLINFGGDLFSSGPRRDGRPWTVAIDDPRATGKQGVGTLELRRGAIATSGDAHRYLLKEGIRYSHILDPRTGWPVRDAPHSVTVLADTCTEAGMLATFAMLQGPDAEAFLKGQQATHWCVR
ncbi:MAG: FAD:protein FMN transferase [Gammaproteobacteria bacterium]|nr:FAD:protein FMN transferase [Gammaproteobacteria bacterium]